MIFRGKKAMKIPCEKWAKIAKNNGQNIDRILP
jgi:hypothetical protein